jgi:hypothetical protein
VRRLLLLAPLACTPDSPATSADPTTAITTPTGTGEPGSTGAEPTTSGATSTSTTGGSTDAASTGADPGTSSTTGPVSTTSSDSSGAASTGEPVDPPPALQSTLITDMNRAYVEMHGGWGHHLRGLMRAADDALWFTVDAGEDVLHNRTIRYFRRGAGEGAWTLVGEQMHGDVVQQNAGSVLVGNFIYTYGVNVSKSYLEECYFDVTDPPYRACNAVTIGGPYKTPPNSNYVGAAVLAAGARIVWFTVVGQNGGPGQFIYTYNYGGGWNGPVVGGITGGANDIGYLHAMATTDGHLHIVGQTYHGAYPDGSYGAVVAEITPGQVPSFLTLEPPEPVAELRSSGDLYASPEGALHVLATFDGTAAYYHRPAGEPWDGHLAPIHVFPDSYRARFARPGGGPLWIVRGSASDQGTTLHRAPTTDVAAAVDWPAAETFPVPAPAPGFAQPAAIYVESPTYQESPAGALNFALCGQYQQGDKLIYHFTD